MDAKTVKLFDKIQKVVTEFEDLPIQWRVGNSELTKDAKSTLISLKIDSRELPQVIKRIGESIELLEND